MIIGLEKRYCILQDRPWLLHALADLHYAVSGSQPVLMLPDAALMQRHNNVGNQKNVFWHF